ncbi:hypothetical protein B0H34DRAFT_647571 [Crassisporium funariophilum]|nr:hypothetical protein B0H34DRAFT_647571 [Crassisporium funariophilum]
MEEFTKRDGHHHNHSIAPLVQLNETEITAHHSPTPPSYYTIDWEDEGYQKRHGGIMIFHGIAMSLAFFIALPLGIALRSVRHTAYTFATLSFYVFCAFGCAASGLYRKLTPNMYEFEIVTFDLPGAVHRSQGYMIILVAVCLAAIDASTVAKRLLTFIRGSDKSYRTFWRIITNKEHERLGSELEYSGLVADEPEDFQSAKNLHESIEPQDVRHNDALNNETEQWASSVHQQQQNYSLFTEGTMDDTQSPTQFQDRLQDVHLRRNMPSWRDNLYRLGEGAFAVIERLLVVSAFAQLLTGIVIYTGGCRDEYLNGCLAHLIKGGIFWCYGLLTFGRFLGSFADLGWAWNKLPSGDHYTAEFVESFVIFLYGATNTWMERFGANPGDPFTTRQIQHISIAVMFCFAGLVGMGIESKRIRKWLASSTFPSLSRPSDMPLDAVAEPLSYRGSFNPFPALVIGVTGAAMAAHAQTYLFQVQIHALWGNLLVAFSVLRCLTYFFLWLGPAKSMLPSRPPTEALGSFFLACGGLVFMLSTEEVTVAAMRRGRDDVMMFLNLAVAITCFAFCWTLLVVGFKGWIKFRTHSTVTYRNAL